MLTFPAERQKDLLVEYGLYGSFTAQWVDIEDLGEIATRFEVAPETSVTCDFRTAMRSYEPSSETRRVWLTRHAPGWSHVLTLSGAMPSSETLSRDGRRVFDLVCIGGIDRIDQLFFTYDGVCEGDVFEPLEYTSYREDFDFPPSLPTAAILEQYLVIMGRITGRFYDREWFSSEGVLCTLPG